VLEPEAVTELLEWFAMASLGARELEDGSSAFAGRMGEALTGDWVDLVDDAGDASELGFGVPFDAEGTTRRRVTLLERGRPRGVVTDRLYGARLGGGSTGHAAPIGVDIGPAPTAMWLSAGTTPAADLVARLGRGIYVTRFHYVNGLLDPRRALMTGMTRDGTFLVEDGRLGRGVVNARFTESLFDALARTEAASIERRAVPTWWTDGGAVVAPALLVRGFRFTAESAP
jgi:predicted Zn-dependent protease